MTRPWRRITLHLSQIFLTLGLTFMMRPRGLPARLVAPPVRDASLLVPVDDPTPGQVVRRELDDDPVLGEDPDVVLSHLAADVGEDLVAVAQLDPEHRVRESFDNCALDLDHAFFLRHVLRNLVATSADLVYRWPGNRPAWRRRATPAGGPRGTVGEPLPAQPSELSFTGLDRAAVGRHETGPRWADTSVYVKVRANPNPRSMRGRRDRSNGHSRASPPSLSGMDALWTPLPARECRSEGSASPEGHA